MASDEDYELAGRDPDDEAEFQTTISTVRAAARQGIDDRYGLTVERLFAPERHGSWNGLSEATQASLLALARTILLTGPDDAVIPLVYPATRRADDPDHERLRRSLFEEIIARRAEPKILRNLVEAMFNANGSRNTIDDTRWAIRTLFRSPAVDRDFIEADLVHEALFDSRMREVITSELRASSPSNGSVAAEYIVFTDQGLSPDDMVERLMPRIRERLESSD